MRGQAKFRGFELQNILRRINTILSKLGFNLDRNRNGVDILSAKLEILEKTKRYSLLLSELFACNDINNFKALLVEVTFAHSFESANLPLLYEVKQSNDHHSTVDFLRETQDGQKIYLELRVTQQRDQIKKEIKNQLKLTNMYSISLNGPDEHEEIVRLQSNILAKTQDKNGNTIKFFSTESGIFNIVVAEISEIILGTVDKSDCMLTAYGDHYVEPHERRKIFGLFQKPESHYPDHILAIADLFSQFRNIIHGILFVVKHYNSGTLDFDLLYYLIPNIEIVNDSEALLLDKEFMRTLRPWNDQ